MAEPEETSEPQPGLIIGEDGTPNQVDDIYEDPSLLDKLVSRKCTAFRYHGGNYQEAVFMGPFRIRWYDL